ncbi:MAG: diguanylate cyclase [Dehalococcoidia bacterium]
MHSLLARQLRRHCIDANTLSSDVQALLAAVSDAYDSSDTDRRMTERSLDLSSLELLSANSELRQKGELLRATLESTADGILAVDATGSVMYYNVRFLELWRVPRQLAERGDDDELLGFVLEQLVDPEAFLRKVRELYASPDESFDALAFRDGHIFERYSRTLPSGTGLAGRVWSFRDVTEREEAVRKILEQARRDSLTGALNHGGITQCLAEQLDRSDLSRVALAMVDIDGMKAVNDTYGHLAGDTVLSAVASALVAEGAVVGRYGGDEFLVVLAGADRAHAEEYVARLHQTLLESRVIDEMTSAVIRVRVSVGLGVYPDEASSMAELIQFADAAMYAAKSKRALEEGHANRRLGDRVSHIVADLVPLLTSSGKLEEKLKLIAGRLSMGTGYDAVDCQIFRDTGLNADSSLHDGRVDELTELWAAEQARDDGRDRPINVILAQTRRPIILENIAADARLNDGERAVLAAAGLESAIVAPMFWEAEFIGTLAVARRSRAAFDPRDAQFLAAIANEVAAIVRMAALMEGMQEATTRVSTAQAETVLMLAAAAEAHDQTTGLHLASIRVLSELIARELEYAPEQIQELGLAATLHDIGKISVPDSILSSPMRFDTDDAEFDRIWDTLKQHTVWGAEFLSGRIGFDLAAKVARWHHERWDGRGYPDGLTGAEIPQEVAIVTVADALDAMIQDRPYRAGRPLAEAIEEIVACRGLQFSPDVVDALCGVHRRGELPQREPNGENQMQHLAA